MLSVNGIHKEYKVKSKSGKSHKITADNDVSLAFESGKSYSLDGISYFG